MCNEIGGPMIAIEKGELARFPTLYSSTEDLRVYVATIGNTGNVSAPTDVAGPGWATPEAIDFEITGAMEFGADAAKFEDILRNGFVKYEDCYNGVDDNNDGAVDCNDWDCEYSSNCTNAGVNAAGFIDTSMPVIEGARIEEYPDSALLMFEASKPVNGTLNFYGNDSQCLTLNKTLYDIGIRSSNVREHKLWQQIAIYNDGGVASLDYDLASDTTYYYKIKICDTDNRCAQSRCSSFVTSNANRCGFCDFVLRLKEPEGWTVSYDADQDGIYEHVQGAVCGPNAGMKMNYTEGRSINVNISKDDGTTYFEFINASVSKSGLNDKVRTLTTSGDNLIGSSTVAGMNSQMRDKLINNLHPEVCRVKVPFSGTCDSLYHCDDNGENCVDKTSEATLIDSSSCVWEIPFCEFSTYRETLPSSSSSSSTSSGSGGGSSSSSSTTTTVNNVTEEEPSQAGGNEEGGGGSGSPQEGGSGLEFSPKDKEKKGLGWVFLIIIVALVVIIGLVVSVLFIKNRKQ
jgi:uncharacterized membrane protein YgcG